MWHKGGAVMRISPLRGRKVPEERERNQSAGAGENLASIRVRNRDVNLPVSRALERSLKR